MKYSTVAAASQERSCGSHLCLFGQPDGFYLEFLRMRSTGSHGDTSVGIRFRNKAHIALFEVSTFSEEDQGGILSRNSSVTASIA